jgi:hypothetical protein
MVNLSCRAIMPQDGLSGNIVPALTTRFSANKGRKVARTLFLTVIRELLKDKQTPPLGRRFHAPFDRLYCRGRDSAIDVALRGFGIASALDVYLARCIIDLTKILPR